MMVWDDYSRESQEERGKSLANEETHVQMLGPEDSQVKTKEG
jgi:hypothetical protein